MSEKPLSKNLSQVMTDGFRRSLITAALVKRSDRDGSTQVFDLGVLNDNQAQGRTVQIQDTITSPTGAETLILQVLMPTGWREVAHCGFQVVEMGQVLLTILASTPQGEVSINEDQ